jgi:hypothetical protein
LIKTNFELFLFKKKKFFASPVHHTSSSDSDHHHHRHHRFLCFFLRRKKSHALDLNWKDFDEQNLEKEKEKYSLREESGAI